MPVSARVATVVPPCGAAITVSMAVRSASPAEVYGPEVSTYGVMSANTPVKSLLE